MRTGVRRAAGYAAVLALLFGTVDAASGAPKGGSRGGPSVSITPYRVTQVTGHVQVSFAANPSTCGPVGRCSFGGSERFDFAKLDPHGPDALVLTKVRAGKQSLSLGAITLAGVASATVNVSGASQPCTDQMGGQVLLLGLAVAKGQRADVGFNLPTGATDLSGLTSSDVLDTRCPGPRLVDLSGPTSPPLGTLDLKNLRQVAITTSRPFDSGGFSGSVEVDVHLAVKRLRVPKQLSKLLGSSG